MSAAPIEESNIEIADEQDEIEDLSSVLGVVQGYLRTPKLKRPLSIVMFGLSETQKSFGVKQLVQRGGIEEQNVLSFNLSELNSIDDLQQSFNQIQSVNLQGKIPIVIYDEFDFPFQGRYLGWLRYFLRPMQDGTMNSGDNYRSFCACIFLFAGKTFASFQHFEQNFHPEDASAKKLDFISRIHTYLNPRKS